MKRLSMILLMLALLLTMAGCSSQPAAPSSPGDTPDDHSRAENRCEEFMQEICSGGGLAEQLLSETGDGGIMAEVISTLSYEVKSQEEQKDGSILCELAITAIDMESLLEALPDDLNSEEEAREAMLDLAESAERAVFTAELRLVPTDDAGTCDVQFGSDLVDAVTGGMLDLIREAYEMEGAA